MQANNDHIPPACVKRPSVHSESDQQPPVHQVTSPPIRLALNQREAAEAIGVSVPTLQQLGIPFIAAGTRRIYPVDTIRSWLVKQAEAVSVSSDDKPHAEADADQPDTPDASGQ